MRSTRTATTRTFVTAGLLVPALMLGVSAPAHAGFHVTTSPTDGSCMLSLDDSANKSMRALSQELSAANRAAIEARIATDPQLKALYEEFVALADPKNPALPVKANDKKDDAEARYAAAQKKLEDALLARKASEWDVKNVVSLGLFGAVSGMQELSTDLYGYFSPSSANSEADVKRLEESQVLAEKKATAFFATYVAPHAGAFFEGAFDTADQLIADAAKTYVAETGPAAYAEVMHLCAAQPNTEEPAPEESAGEDQGDASTDPAGSNPDASPEKPATTPSTSKPAPATSKPATPSTKVTAPTKAPAPTIHVAAKTPSADEGLSSFANIKTLQAIMTVITVLVAVLAWSGKWPQFSS